MQHFSELSLWYGPFYDRVVGSAQLAFIAQLHSKAWFHGNIQREESEKMLAHQREGTFLVRVASNKADHPFTVSVNIKNPDRTVTPQHKRIKHTYGIPKWLFPVGTTTMEFKSLWELIDSPKCGLVYACPKRALPVENNYQEAKV